MASSTSFSIPPAVTVLEQCQISPSPDGLPITVGEVCLSFTSFDVMWLGSHPVERLFFYRWPGLTTTHFVASALPRLKWSLSLTLRHYYPLAGSLRSPPPGSDRFHICCTNADSVPFTLAECDGADYFHHLAGDLARRVNMFCPLVPEVPKAGAMMAVQVTVFPGAGVCLGVAIHHVACDGSGFTSFMKSWASACRSEQDAATPPDVLPIFDRTLVADPDGLYTLFYDSMKRLAGEEEWLPVLSVGGPTVVRSTFLLNRCHIEELRRRVSEQRPPPPSVLRYSSFVLTCAYVWVCLLRAEEEPLPPDVGDATYLFFAVDIRSRLLPPVPTAYLGNCIGVCFVDARRSELLGEGGVGLAAVTISESVARLGKDGEVLRDAQEWMSKIEARLPRRPLTIAGSPRFEVYTVDFGWGRPAKVEVVGIERTGAVALAQSREEDGGIEVGVALPAEEMAKFSSLFAAGLEDNANEARK